MLKAQMEARIIELARIADKETNRADKAEKRLELLEALAADVVAGLQSHTLSFSMPARVEKLRKALTEGK